MTFHPVFSWLAGIAASIIASFAAGFALTKLNEYKKPVLELETTIQDVQIAMQDYANTCSSMTPPERCEDARGTFRRLSGRLRNNFERGSCLNSKKLPTPKGMKSAIENLIGTANCVGTDDWRGFDRHRDAVKKGLRIT